MGQSKKSLLGVLFTMLLILTLVVPAASNEDTITKHKIIDERIEKGLSYLYEMQRPSGDFFSYISYSPEMTNSTNVSLLFDTAFILHTLNLIDNEDTKEMKNKAVAFLLDNKMSHGVWTHKGKYRPGLIPDTDDTSMAFAALVESGVNISDESLDYMLDYRRPDGVFYTWITSEEWLDPSNPYYEAYMGRSDTDASVNANVLYAYSLRNRTQSGIIRYLNNIAENKSFLNGTFYYPSPYVFTYLVTRDYSDGDVKELEPSLANIRNYLLATQKHDGSWGNDLDTALATVSLLNIGYDGPHLKKAINHILISQRKNGSWSSYAFYIAPVSPTNYYGSQELTTSFSLEALIKYKKTTDSDRIEE
jgi:hypothetical protein